MKEQGIPLIAHQTIPLILSSQDTLVN